MPEPIVLGFDTSAAYCAAAVLVGDSLAAHRLDAMQKGQVEYLFPMLEDMLERSAIGWRDLTAIGVGIGPGNFTGIRVAVAAARGLALSLGIPAIGVSVTQATAFGHRRPCRVVLEAKHDQVIWQDFNDNDDGTPNPQQSLTSDLPRGPTPVTARFPLAESIARIAAHSPASAKRPAPIYLRPADAAPSRDAAPLIMP